MTFYTVGQLAKLHGVSPSTIRRWEASGLVSASKRTLGGHRRFWLDDHEETKERRIVGYARVSSHDQKEDLQRQIDRLCTSGCDEVLSDIGSGLNSQKVRLAVSAQKTSQRQSGDAGRDPRRPPTAFRG